MNDGYWHHLGFVWSNDVGRWSVLIDGVVWALRSNIQPGEKIPGKGTLVVGQTGSGINFLHSYVGVISRLNIWDVAFGGYRLETLARIPGNEKGSLLSWTDFMDYISEDAEIINPSDAHNTGK